MTDIEPDAEVKRAMNRINAADREKTAAQYEGDAARHLIFENNVEKEILNLKKFFRKKK